MRAAFDPDLIAVFILAAFLGFQLIKRVSTLLHSPLMSLTNAIAAVAVVGAIIILGEDHTSILSLYHALIALRKQTPALISGAYVPLAAQGELLLYRRRDQDESLLIALNLGSEPVSLLSDSIGLSGEILLSTEMDRAGEAVGETLDLRGNEGVILGPAKVPVI